MFDTQMTWIAFVVIILQGLGLIYGLFLFTIKPNDYSLKIFIQLTVVFIIYNTAGALLPDARLPYLIGQRVFADMTGLFMCLFTFWYFVQEYIVASERLWKKVSIIVLLAFAMLTILELNFNQIEPFRTIFLVSMVIIAAILLFIILKNHTYSQARAGGYLVFISMLTLPLITIFSQDNQFIEVPFVNFGYFVLMFMYFQETARKLRARVGEEEGIFTYENIRNFKIRFKNMKPRLQELAGILGKTNLSDEAIIEQNGYNLKTYRNYKSEIWKSLNFNTLHLKSEAEKRNILRQYIMRL